ncbi:WhiB family transcriptional regulator [Micromonospora sp. MS34]|uniref:WhiB family transcriptional regulator n=1 Tax=Micromonospora sp. MS34 TaxID=3385971 RepID=UPI0039A1643E
MTAHRTTWAPRPTFIDHADQPPACRSHDPDLWFRPGDEAEAKAICATCPHEQPCRVWAYAQPVDRLYGVWGGTTHNERRRNWKPR